jgi:putative membrane protein
MLQNTSTKTINIIIAIISIVVPALVIAMLKIAPPTISQDTDLSIFPKFNAIVNTGTTLCLLVGLFFIKNKNSNAHRLAMLSALLLSVLFLLSYVVYHTLNAEDKKFLGEGFIRYVYFFILISHILLSTIVLPFVLKTFSFAFQNKFVEHKKWAKFTFPLWLYVAITGVLVYVFMAPYY